MHKRKLLNSPRLLELKNKKRKVFIRKVIFFAILCLIVLIIVSLVSRIHRLNINSISAEGNNVIDTEKIQSVVERDTRGSYAWLFPKTNIFLYPKNKIKKDLSDEFKRFKEVNVSIQSGQNLVVSVSERSPEYMWCGGNIPTVNNDQENCYFLDSEGYIFDQAPYFSGEVYFKFYGKTTRKTDDPTGSYIAPEYFEKLITFKDALKDMGLKPAVLYIADNGDIKLYLSRTHMESMGPEINFKKDSDFQKIAENLKAALTTEPLQTKFKKEYSNLEYIDLKFSNKVYYKFK